MLNAAAADAPTSAKAPSPPRTNNFNGEERHPYISDNLQTIKFWNEEDYRLISSEEGVRSY